MKTRLASLVFLAATTPAVAQWLGVPMHGIPRTADGAPDLSAPTPRLADERPDLSGLWRPERTRGNLNDRSNYQPWVVSLIEERERTYFAEDPRYRCLPAGPSNLTTRSNSFGLREFVQHPNMLVMLYNDGTYRQIFMDGRELEDEPLSTWMGYSVGHWDGDTLVVQSNGYNDQTWIGRGVSHTSQLRTTERYTRTDFGHMQVEVTIEDPGAFKTPLNATIEMEFAADERMLETVCAEADGGEQGSWTSEVSDRDETAVDVAEEVLARYVGTYGGMYLQNDTRIVITLDDGKLFLQKNNGRKDELIPKSDNSFLQIGGGFGYVFTVDDQGVSTTISEVHVSGAWPFNRIAD